MRHGHRADECRSRFGDHSAEGLPRISLRCSPSRPALRHAENDTPVFRPDPVSARGFGGSFLGVLCTRSSTSARPPGTIVFGSCRSRRLTLTRGTVATGRVFDADLPDRGDLVHETFGTADTAPLRLREGIVTASFTTSALARPTSSIFPVLADVVQGAAFSFRSEPDDEDEGGYREEPEDDEGSCWCQRSARRRGRIVVMN